MIRALTSLFLSLCVASCASNRAAPIARQCQIVIDAEVTRPESCPGWDAVETWYGAVDAYRRCRDAVERGNEKLAKVDAAVKRCAP